MKTQNRVVGIDLAALPRNPTGWALLEDSKLSVQQFLRDKEILEETIRHAPNFVAIDAPLSLPKNKHAYMREADIEMHRKGYTVLPPRFRSMEKLTFRASKITLELQRKLISVIEVHPLSSRKTLRIPKKEWKTIHEIFAKMGLIGDWQKRVLTSHEIDATTAVLTGYLHLKRKTELIGDPEEGIIVMPKPRDWRTLKL